MTPSSHGDRILTALARQRDERPLTWIELSAELPSMLAGDLSVNLEELEREGLVEKERQAGIRGRPWGWSLTDAGRKRAGAAKAKPQPKPAGTVADLVQEIKAEQDAAVPKALDTTPDPRRPHDPPWLRETRKRFEEGVAEADPERNQRMVLTLRDDGTLLIVSDSGALHVALSPGQTSQLGEFLTKTAGVWQCPY